MENPIIQNPVQNVIPSNPPKHFPFLTVLLSLLAYLLLLATGYFAYQNMQLRKQIVELSKPIPTPSPTPAANLSRAEPKDWKTYTNPKLLISLQYPPDFRVTENNKPGTNSLDDGIYIDENQSNGTPERFIQIHQSSKTGFWNDAYMSQLFSVPLGYTLLLPGADQTQKEFSTLTRLPNEYIAGATWQVYENKNPWETPAPVRIFVIRQNNSYYIFESTYTDLTDDNSSEYVAHFIKTTDQILSTFKFLGPGAAAPTPPTTYTCPPTGWVDCEPVMDAAKQKACSEKAMAWYKANCPDFKGGAL